MREQKCAFLGPIGTYSYQACLSFFAPSSAIPKETIKEILSSNEDCLLVPLENSTFGSVAQTLDNLHLTNFIIQDSVLLPVDHCLLSLPNAIIKRIYSHPEALGQCSKYLQDNYGDVELVPVQSTAHGAVLASKDIESGCISSRLCAELFKLEIRAEHIAPGGNVTRFVVMSRDSDRKDTGNEFTLLSISTKDLAKCLKVLSTGTVVRIDSRPVQDWNYLYYATLKGYHRNPDIITIINELKLHSTVKVYGSYTA